MVSTDCVGVALRYVLCVWIFFMKRSTKSTAISSTRLSLLPNCGYSPSISKSVATFFATPSTSPFLFLISISLRIGFTFAYLIAESESAATESPAIPQAIVRNTSRSWNAINAASYAYLSCMKWIMFNAVTYWVANQSMK